MNEKELCDQDSKKHIMAFRVRPVLLFLLLFVALIASFGHRTNAVSRFQQTVLIAQAGGTPIPRPSASGCAMFQQMYPPTQQAFDEQHLSAKQQAEVLKWVAKMSPDDRRYAKWWLAPSSQYGPLLLVFSTKSVRGETWDAVNRNVSIDFVTCEYFPHPGV